MLKISLYGNTFVLHLVSQDKTIEINNGIYGNKKYSSLVLSSDAVFLEGASPLVLSIAEPAIYLSVKSVIDRIAEILDDKSVLIEKMNAIPEDRSAEILTRLLE